MKKSAENNSVKVLLRDTILALCRNTLAYRSKVSVEGLIGVTLDDDEIILVSINDMIRGDDAKDRDDSSESSDSESDTGGSSRKKKRRRRKRSGSRDGRDGAPTPKKSMDQGLKIKGEENEDVMVIIKEETPEENPDLEWMKNMDSSFHQQPQDQSGNVYGNFPNLQSTMGAAAYPGPSTMASQQPVTTQGQGPGQQQEMMGQFEPWTEYTQGGSTGMMMPPGGNTGNVNTFQNVPVSRNDLSAIKNAAKMCQLCGKVLVGESVYAKHFADCQAKKAICPYCGHRNRHSGNLRVHVRNNHPEQFAKFEATKHKF